MKVRNEHARHLYHLPDKVGGLVDRLSSREDAVWPHERWPRMVLDGPLEVGARGGHGPIRYRVERYEPGRLVKFRFTSPPGFHGTHSYQVIPLEDGCELRHIIDMRTSGTAFLTWPVIFRPLHDALLEDSLDKVAALLEEEDWQPRRWPGWVRFLRWVLGARRRRRR